MYTAKEMFGISGEELAVRDAWDPQTPAQRTVATASKSSLEPPRTAVRALADPQGSAIFWIAAAAILGLILITGRLRVEAALGGRAGRK